MSKLPTPFLILATGIELLLLGLRFIPNLGAWVVEAITVLVLTHILYLVSSYLALAKSRPGTGFVLVTAIVFRLTLWTAFPALSDDIYRYRWEGKLQSAGGNPYQVRPQDPAWASLRDEAFSNVGSRDFKAGYGPLTEWMQRWTYAAVSSASPNPFIQVFWTRLPAAVFDLGIIAVLLALLREHGLPSSRILLYAWSPIPLIEFWWSGHNDAYPVFFVLLATLLFHRRRWVWTFMALSLGVAAKFWPLLLFPLFIFKRVKGEAVRWWQWTVLFPVFAVCAIPYWSPVIENVQFMSGFLGGWRNNDSLFGLILWISSGDLYGAKYLVMAVLAAASVAVVFLRTSMETAILALLAVTLLVSANSHPWYLAWLSPWLVFCPFTPLLLWGALSPIAYGVLIRWKILGEWQGSTSERWFIYVPLFACMLVKWYLQSSRWGRKTKVNRSA